MFSLRACVRTGRLAASLSRNGRSLRLTISRCRIFRCLCVLTVRVFITVRLIESRERIVSAVFSILSKGSICLAIWRSTVGLTPRGMNPGSAAPDRWEAAAVDANTDWMCLFLGGCNPSLILSPQSAMAVSAVSACCVGNHVVSVSSPPHSRFFVLRGARRIGGVCSAHCSGSVSRYPKRSCNCIVRVCVDLTHLFGDVDVSGGCFPPRFSSRRYIKQTETSNRVGRNSATRKFTISFHQSLKPAHCLG